MQEPADQQYSCSNSTDEQHLQRLGCAALVAGEVSTEGLQRIVRYHRIGRQQKTDDLKSACFHDPVVFAPVLGDLGGVAVIQASLKSPLPPYYLSSHCVGWIHEWCWIMQGGDQSGPKAESQCKDSQSFQELHGSFFCFDFPKKTVGATQERLTAGRVRLSLNSTKPGAVGPRLW